jgi:hypothetical protein
MIEKLKSKQASRYLALMILFLLFVTSSLCYLLVRQAKHSIISLMHTRMLDVSNIAASMIDGDTLRTVTPEDEGTEGYEIMMRTLTYVQDSVDMR